MGLRGMFIGSWSMSVIFFSKIGSLSSRNGLRLNETFGPVFYSVIRLGLSVNSFVAVHGFGSNNRMSLNFPGVSVNHSRFILGQQRNNWSILPLRWLSIRRIERQ